MSNSKAISTFSSISTWNSFVREVQSNHDYKGKDEQGNPVYQHTTDYPTIEFNVTHKIGGCNMSIGNDGFDEGEFKDFFYQSREMLLNNTDLCGFKDYFSKWKLSLANLFERIHYQYRTLSYDEIIIYGEWCGQGIPEKASISQTEGKKWIIFAIKINGEYVDNFVELQDNEIGIYNVLQFENFKYSINFSQFEEGCWKDKSKGIPKELQDLVNSKTINCPVSKSFGVEGLGEGLVFIANHNGKEYKLKIKNTEYEKSSLKSEKKQDKNDISLIPESFIQEVCAENRLEQFKNKLILEYSTIEMKHIPLFIKMIVDDVIKEEQIAIEELINNNTNSNSIKWEDSVKNYVRTWFISQIKK